MDALLMNSIGDNKHRIGNPNRNFGTNRTLFPYPSDNLLLTNLLAGGHFAGGGFLSMPPPSLSNSYPSPVSVFRSPQNFHHYRHQPPLLPLPISMPVNHQNINISRTNSTPNNNIRSSPPRINKNIKKPKKSKNQKKDSKRDLPDLPPPATTEDKEASPAESSANPLIKPDLKEVVISRVFSSSISNIVSPPPSSLPLPTFSLRSKVSCKAEASLVDAGATDSLRRLLRL